jgi:glucose-1-phosphate adenylyltransferase
MDFQEMIKTHVESKAEATIASLPVPEAEARACGIMRIDESGRVIDFEEKPKTPEALARVRTEATWMERFGIEAEGRPYLASMGIYLFNRSTLVQMLAAGDATDFGKEIFPQAIGEVRVQAHLFDSYWEDIGTVGAFHKANIDLTADDPPFDFTYGDHPVFTRPRYLPCARISGASIKNCLIADGAEISRDVVLENSVIGVRSQIAEGAVIRNTYIMGADLFEQSRHLAANERAGRPNIGIGAGSRIENAIIDKNARIGKNVRIVNEAGIVDSEEAPHYVIRDGIVVIPKNTIIQDGTVI